MPVHLENDQSLSEGQKAVPVGAPGPQDQKEIVTRLAHTLWERRGRPRDDDWADWLAAEAQAQESGSG